MDELNGRGNYRARLFVFIEPAAIIFNYFSSKFNHCKEVDWCKYGGKVKTSSSGLTRIVYFGEEKDKLDYTLYEEKDIH